MVDAHSATAADFDIAAQRHASAFWFWLILAGVVWWFFSFWWSVAPALIGLVRAILFFGATQAGDALRMGQYRVLNPNNGAPDGDAANWLKPFNANTDPPELVSAQRASVWIPWYFAPKIRTFLTAPLFALFALALTTSVAGALIQGIALISVSYAVFGWLGLSLLIAGGWILVLLPPSLFYSLMKNLPGVWMRKEASFGLKATTSMGVILCLPLAASLIYQGTGLGITWIADRDPCAAFSAGVTGSIPPTDCH